MLWAVQGCGCRKQGLQELVGHTNCPRSEASLVGEPIRISLLWVEAEEGALHLTWELKHMAVGSLANTGHWPSRGHVVEH